MSREWSRDAFAPADVAPKSFVPHGFVNAADAVVLDPARLFELMRTARAGFQPTGVRRSAVPVSFVPQNIAAARVDPRADEVLQPETVSFAEEVSQTSTAEAIDHQAVFDAGVAEGQRRAALAGAANADACAKLLSSAAGAGRFDRGALALKLRQTVLHLVGQLVGEAAVSHERLGSRVDEAVRMLADVTEPARLSLHPDDLAMMHDRLVPNIAAIPDPAMERGGFRLETLSATVEDGPTLWLEQLEAALDRVAAPGE